MINITNKCLIPSLLALLVMAMATVPVSAQDQDGEQIKPEHGLQGQFQILHSSVKEDSNRNQALQNNNIPNLQTEHNSENERWSGQFGEAYVQPLVQNVREHDGELYLMGEINIASDGETVTPASGLVKWDGESYSNFPGQFDGPVYDVERIGSDLIVGGAFSSVNVDGEEIELNNIARWDGENWTPLGEGTNDEVWALLTVNNTIYAGGRFTTSDGDQVDSPHIARWSENSQTWNSLSGTELNNDVQTITTDGTNIYAGGNFNNDGLNHIAVWDGTDWESIGEGFNGLVTDIQLHNDIVYAAGHFDERGDGSTLRYIGMYDLSEDEGDRQWESPGQSSPDDLTYRMSIHNDELYLSGRFQNIGINEIMGVARLEDGQWQPVGNGINGSVVALQHLPDGTLFAGGSFEQQENISIPNFATFNGEEWQRVGSQEVALSFTQLVDGELIYDAIYYQEDLYVTGLFTEIGGVEVSGIARWDGEEWNDVDGGITYADDEEIAIGATLLVHEGDLYIGGQFNRAGSLSQPANNIARWNGQSWSRLGSGIAGDDLSIPYIYRLVEYDDNIYAVGDFTEAAGVPVSDIAYWNGSDWFDVGYGTQDSNGLISDIHKEDDNLYVAGNFTEIGPDESPVPANGVAVWNEADEEWSPLGNGFTGQLYTITRFDGELIVGGAFENHGPDSDVSGFAAWDPVNETWGDFRNANLQAGGGVTDLEIVNETLFISGAFDEVNGQENVNTIASYSLDDGWSSLGNGVTSNEDVGLIYNLKEQDGKLWTMGIFTQAGNRSAHGISNWDLQLDVSIENPVTEAPERHQLNQNYPNPFNPVTTIRFELEETAAVNLQVFDMLGRQVATVVETQMSSGAHTVSFDASGLSSGMYLYRLEARSGSGHTFTQSRKMTLIK